MLCFWEATKTFLRNSNFEILKKLLNKALIESQNLFKILLMALIYIYRGILSPFLGGNCRFHPTCSHYAIEALEVYPPLSALKFIFTRLSKCHPWGTYGIDQIPPKGTK